MNPLARLAAVATVAALAIGGSLYLLGGPDSGFGGRPTPSPSIAPTPTTAPLLPSASPSTGACSLVTSEEAESLAGIQGLGALPTETGTGNITTCSYSDGGGNLVVRLTYTKTGGATEFDVVQSAPGVQVVTEIGDEAVFDPDSETLYVLKGDAFLAIFAGAFGQSTTRLALESAIGEVAAARM